MKNSVSGKAYSYKHIIGKAVRNGLILFTVGALSTTAAQASNSTIRFHGSITQASCEVRAPQYKGLNDRVLSVSPGVTLTINTLNNVCSAAEVPFSVAYRQLPGSSPAAGDSRLAVVTLTYD